jgi:hypothetical protein
MMCHFGKKFPGYGNPIVVEKGEDASSFQCSESVNEQSTLKPEPLESVTLSQRFTKRTGACRLFECIPLI